MSANARYGGGLYCGNLIKSIPTKSVSGYKIIDRKIFARVPLRYFKPE